MTNEGTRKIFDENLGDLKEDLWNAAFVYQTYRIWKGFCLSKVSNTLCHVFNADIFCTWTKLNTLMQNNSISQQNQGKKKQSFKNIFY